MWSYNLLWYSDLHVGCVSITSVVREFQFLFGWNLFFCFCYEQRVRAGLTSPDPTASSTVAVLSPYVVQSHAGHVTMTSHRCDDIVGGTDAQQQVNTSRPDQLEATSSMTSLYDNLATGDKTRDVTSADDDVIRRDDYRRRESFTVADDRQQAPRTTDTGPHYPTVRYSPVN